MLPRAALSALVVTVLAGTLPAPAFAGTASIVLEQGPLVTTPQLSYQAAAGERNDVDVESGDGLVRIEDRAGLTPGPGCRLEAGSDGTIATCAIEQRGVPSIRVALGDRDDRVRVRAPFGGDVLLTGGTGDDRMRSAGLSHNRFAGGSGDDVMSGGGFSTLFDEGARPNGSDTMTARTPPQPRHGWHVQPKVWVDYARRRSPIRADLGRGRDDGEEGERDRLGRGVTGIRGGRAPDLLVGDGGHNQLAGGAGADVLMGRAGDDAIVATFLEARGGRVGRHVDRLFGGAGHDFLEGSDGDDLLVGGSGPDRLEAGDGADRVRDRDGYADEIRCVGGRDRVRQDAIDLVRWCEGSSASGVAIPVRVYASQPGCILVRCPGHGAAVVTVGCGGTRGRPCRGSVRLELAGRVIGTAAFSVAPCCDSAELELPLTDAYYERLVRRDRRLSVVAISEHGREPREVTVAVRRMGRASGGRPILPRRL